MEGVVRGPRRQSEIITEVYGSSTRVSNVAGTRLSLISKADWDHPGSFDDGNMFASETTNLLGKVESPSSIVLDATANNKDGISFLAEVPAIIVTLMINFMTAIPFGVAYFPLGWAGDGSEAVENDDSTGAVSGPFPLPGKEILGIRMFLFASITGQIVMALASKFGSPVSVQLIENVPFYHALASIVIAEQGYGIEALSTLFFLFGLGSIVTGLMFYGLGKAGLGKVVYYFPSHVLVGFIGGIGVFIVISSIGVMTGKDFEFTTEGFQDLAANFWMFAPALAFEIVLRILMVLLRNEDGKPKFQLLAPLYFISIVPMFYVALITFGISMDEATDWEMFFPAASTPEPSEVGYVSSFSERILDRHTLDMFRVIHFNTVSWTAVRKSLATIVGMGFFSVINAPINIPAFANTCGADVDMNNELIAHGYSNILAGFFGGIQNVMTYSISVLFYKSGGRSKAAQLVLVVGMIIIFVFGLSTMPYIPKCMAGTLLLHIGVDLFMEGVYDSFGDYDKYEYGGVWVITAVMTFMGMTPALLTGIIVALATYALQSVQYLDPIFKITNASTLKSSAWTRPPEALAVLDSISTGRSRIMVIQLQGNLFFGNVVDMGDTIKDALARQKPIIVMIDFTLVVSMDSSAAQAVNKLKNTMHKNFNVQTNIFVMGQHRDYFPCEYGLSTAILEEGLDEEAANVLELIPRNQICKDFDEGLIFAEDILITREDPTMLKRDNLIKHSLELKGDSLTEEEENNLAVHYLRNLIKPGPSCDEKRDAITFLSYFQREVYKKGEAVWKQGDKSDSAKLVLSGNLVASIPASDVREEIPRGVVIGELGLIDGVTDRLSTVLCESDRAVIYSLEKMAWEKLIQEDPAVARVLDQIAIRYLSHRVQRVSNRIVSTNCLPV